MGNKRQKILFIALAILVVVYLADQGIFSSSDPGKGGSDGRREGSISAENLQRTVEADRAGYQSTDRLKEFTYDGDWETDPFYYLSPEELEAQNNGLVSALFGSEGDAGSLTLTAISLRGTRGMAIINDEIVTEGDRIGGFVVDQIESNFVILKKGNQPLRINLEN